MRNNFLQTFLVNLINRKIIEQRRKGRKIVITGKALIGEHMKKERMQTWKQIDLINAAGSMTKYQRKEVWMKRVYKSKKNSGLLNMIGTRNSDFISNHCCQIMVLVDEFRGYQIDLEQMTEWIEKNWIEKGKM